MKFLPLLTCLFFLSPALTAQESFDYQLFRFGVQYLYEDTAPTTQWQSQILGMRLEPDEFAGPEEPIFTYESLHPIRPSDQECLDVVPSFAGYTVQQADGVTSLEVGSGTVIIRSQEHVGATWEASDNISARVTDVAFEEFLGLTDSVKYIRFFRTTDGTPLAVPLRVSKSYGLLTGTFFWQLEATTTPLQLIGLSEPAAGLRAADLDNTLNIAPGTELNILRQAYASSGGEGYWQYREQKLTAGTFTCDPIVGTRNVEFSFDEYTYKTEFAENASPYDRTFTQGNIGSWRVNETDHDWLNAQPGELYSSDERAESLFVASRRFGCLGIGTQAYNLIEEGGCFLDGTILDAVPTGYYFPGLGGPYFSLSQTGGVPGNLVGVIADGDTCRMPFDFGNLIIDNTDDFRPDARIRLFPNPASGRVMLDVPADLGALSYRVYNAQGQLLQSGAPQPGNRSLDLTAFTAGFYTVAISQPSGLTVQRRLILR